MPLGHDLRIAVRAFLGRPVLSLVSVVSLGMGIAAVTSMWAAVDTLLVRPLPYDPDGKLVFVGTVTAGRGAASSPTAVPDCLDLPSKATRVRLAAYRSVGVNLAGEPAEWVPSRRVSAGSFGVIGVGPALGRAFLPRDEAPGAAEVEVLGRPLWERRFGAEPGILGRTITVDGVTATVVGVLPARFEFAFDSPDLWLPLRMSGSESRLPRSVSVVGRVPGGDPSAARTELEALGAGLAAAWPETNAERTLAARGGRDEWFGGAVFRQGAAASLVAALLVLLIGCANVATLLLARGTDRAGEIALRRALGASRLRVMRQLLVEAFVLGGAGGVLGILASLVGIRALVRLPPESMPGLEGVRLDARALALGVAVVVVSALVSGMLPALRTLQGGTRSRLQSGRSNATEPGPGRRRTALVGAEVALALVLLATTGLVLRSATVVRAVETGYDTEGVHAFRVDLPETRYLDSDALREAARRIEEEMSALPAVSGAAVAVGVPARSWRSLGYEVPDEPAGGTTGSRSVVVRFVTPGYLPALGVQVTRGRPLARTDVAGSAEVVLVSEGFARRHWPEGDPLGRTGPRRRKDPRDRRHGAGPPRIRAGP